MMYQVFRWGCPDKEDSKSLEVYLLQDKKMSKSLFNRIFNRTMKNQIKYKSCDQFDISLMLKVIKVACNGVADKDSDVWWKEDDTKLEYLLTCLKNERNDLAHNLPKMNKRDMLKKIDELRDLFIQIVMKACDRYDIDEATKDNTLKEMKYHIDRIRNEPLSEAEILQHQKELLFEHLMYILVDKGSMELKQRFSHLTLVNPVSFIDGYDTQIKLDLVISKIVMVEADQFCKGDIVDHKNIFKLIKSHDRLATDCKDNEIGTFILIEGVAGSGKTTLSKLLMCEWSKPASDIQGLTDYDLILHLECRNYCVDSFTRLLKCLIPKTYSLIGDDILTCSLQQKLLIIVDGLDELNVNSMKAFNEILNVCRTTNHTVLCTSRPEKVRDIIMRVPEEFYKIHLQITGIPVDQRPTFVQKYHEQLVKMKRSQQSTKLLIDYVQKSLILKEFFRYPLNLVLLTYLWAYGPNEVNEITTMTELYMKVQSMLKQKLIQRLKHCDSTRDYTTQELEEKIEAFLKGLYCESLVSVSLDEIILHSKSKERLKQLCSNLSLPFKEVSSAFLVFQVVLTSTGSEEQLCFPHKDVHDFFAAFGLFLAITDQSYYESLLKIIQVPFLRKFFNSVREPLMKLLGPRAIRHIFEVLHPNGHASLDVSKFQNILKHFGGLLNIHGGEIKEQVTKELVELFNETGITDQEQWLDIIGEVKCDDQTSKYISRSFFKNVQVITIKSPRVAGYSSLMNYIDPKHVILDLEGDPDDLPHLEKLLKAISLKACNVDLKLHHHFCHPELNKPSDDILLSLLHYDSRCRVERVMGYLSGREMPPLFYLKHVAVVLSSNEQARAVTSTILQYPLEVKEIRVMPNVSPAVLMRLPSGEGEDHLDLSEVEGDQIDWACQVAQVLMREAGFHSIKLPECDLTADVGLKLECSLIKAEVKTCQFIPFSYIEKVEEMSKYSLITIKDTNVEEYAYSLVFADPVMVELNLVGDPDYLPQLKKLLKVISMKNCEVDLELNHHLLHPRENKLSDDLLLCLQHENARCQVKRVTGHLSGKKIPRLYTLRQVTVVLLNDDEARAVTSSILQRRLVYKRIRVVQGVSPDKLMRLPSGNGEAQLDLYKVGDEHKDWACQVAAALMGEAGFSTIHLSGSDLSVCGCKKLINSLSQAGVKIQRILQVCTDAFFSYEDMKFLMELAKDKLKCKFERERNTTVKKSPLSKFSK